MTDLICFHALGSLELTRGSMPVPLLHRGKRFALFVVLALSRSPFRSRDSLQAMFWPESDHHRARKSLNTAIYALREHLGNDFIVSRGADEIGIAVDLVWCDARAFDESIAVGDPARALGLYAGDLMAGFFISGAPAFEHWLDSERDRLRRAAHDAAWQCAERAEQAGDLGEAAKWARRAVEAMFDDERSVRRLIELLDRAGDRRGAIHMYELFAQELQEEYGTKPAPETRRLIAAILARDEPRALSERHRESRIEPPTRRIQPTMPRVAAIAPALWTASPTEPEVSVDAPARVIPEQPPSPDALTSAAKAVHRRVRLRNIRNLLAVVGALSVFAGVWLARGLSIDLQAGTKPRIDAQLVISRFETLGDDSEFTSLAAAIKAALIQQLAEVSAIEVVTDDAYARSMNTLARPRARAASPPLFLVRGSVMPSQELVRVGVDLIDASTGNVLRSARIDQPATYTLRLIDEVARRIGRLLRAELGHEIRFRRWRARARSVRVLELLDRAEGDRRRARTLGEDGNIAVAALQLARADSLLALAEREDPTWVDLTVWRVQVASDAAWLYFLPLSHDTASANDWIEDGIAHADRALARDTNHAAALALRGTLRYWSSFMAGPGEVDAAALLFRAEKDFRRSLSADMRSTRAWSVLSAILYARGDFAGAYAAAERAYRADAYLGARDDILIRLALTAHEIGSDSLAWDWCSIVTAEGAGRPISGYCRLHLIAWGDERHARPPLDPWEIVAEATDAPVGRAMRPHFEMLAATVLARRGLADSAAAVAKRAARGYPDDELLLFEAGARIALGETDSAATLLRRYVAVEPARRHGIIRSRRFSALDSLLEPLWPVGDR